jgi:hypothetical protein
VAQPLAALLGAPAPPQLRAAAASALAVLLQGRPAAAAQVAAAAGASLRGLLADTVPGALGAGRGGRAGAELLLVSWPWSRTAPQASTMCDFNLTLLKRKRNETLLQW